MDLISKSSNWLKATDFSKSIQVRTKDVLGRFHKYVSRLQDDAFQTFLTPTSKNECLDLINGIRDQVDDLINSYLKGNLCEAIAIAHDLIAPLGISQCDAYQNFYRARSNESGYEYTKDEMFHIPYNLRHKVTNQRYSVTGLPCLYIATSTYLAWEELERPDYQTCNYCLLINKQPLAFYDLCIPNTLSSKGDIRRTCLALASSLKCQKEHIFKLEYIVPQSLLQSITREQMLENECIGIRYYSTPFLNKETNVFRTDFNNEKCTSRFINIVIPAQSPKRYGLSSQLNKLFRRSSALSMMQRYLMNNSSDQSTGDSHDDYERSQFAMIEQDLYKKLKEETYSSKRVIRK